MEFITEEDANAGKFKKQSRLWHVLVGTVVEQESELAQILRGTQVENISDQIHAEKLISLFIMHHNPPLPITRLASRKQKSP